MAIERCACGRPLHYANAADRAMTQLLNATEGPHVAVQIKHRIWLVQRHYFVLHGPVNLDKMKFPELLEDGVYLPFLYDTDGARISTAHLDHTNQVFSHVDNDDGTERHFHIPKLQRLADEKVKGVELIEFGIIAPHVQFVIDNRGVDEFHINERLTDDMLEKPGLMCAWPDGTQLVVDGNHRYVARFRRGKPHMAFWVFPEAVWRRSLLTWVTGLTGV
jgi:hypothetical protein